MHDDVTAGDWIALLLLRLTIFLFAHLGTTKYLARRKSANPEYTRIMRQLGNTSWRKDIKPRKNASSSSAGSTGSISVEFSITRPSTSVRNVPQRSARKTMPIDVVELTIDIMAGQPTFSVRLGQAWQGALWVHKRKQIVLLLLSNSSEGRGQKQVTLGHFSTVFFSWLPTTWS